MGVDCKIYLPPATRIDDVGDVIGILAGNKPEKESLGDRSGGWYVRVPTVEVTNSSMVECANIGFRNNKGDRDSVFYHFEGKDGIRQITVRSTPFWIAAGQKLVDFFGGSVDYADSDETCADYERPFRTDIHEEDGEPWQAFQQRMFDVVPLTKSDLKQAQQYAAYKEM